jgi:peptidoglycan/xylan/chitin deacetylase (PgdA/CDA1 family)
MNTCSMSSPNAIQRRAFAAPRVAPWLVAFLVAACLQVFAALDAKADPVIVDTAITNATARDGQTVRLRYRIQSSSSQAVQLGATIQSPNGINVTDSRNDRTVNVSAGTNWYERDFFINLPAAADIGAYRVTWNISGGSIGSDSRSRAGALQIQAPIPVDAHILMYHKVGDVAHSRFWVSTAQLEAQIRALKQHGYTFVTLQDLMDYRAGLRAAPAKPVVMTFDDGYEDVLTKIIPIISKPDLRIPITVFLNPGLMGQDNSWDTGLDFGKEPVVRHMTWPQARTVHQSGLVDFQSHTMTHINLLTNPDTRRQELLESRQRIEAEFGREVRFFSHPYGAGATNDQIKHEIHEAGYFAATGTNHAPETRLRDKFGLRRHDIHWEVTTTFDAANPQNFLFGPKLLNDPDVYSGGDYHPADTNRDWVISISELTAYGAAWRQGNNVQISYLTRAGSLWRAGGAYRFDPSAGQKPVSWVTR